MCPHVHLTNNPFKQNHDLLSTKLTSTLKSLRRPCAYH
uniref:Uncharacterized protein n=1 Tax=Rhizophora mucronata TaxID=61149 RepID=A0A2P2P054_RHIMU